MSVAECKGEAIISLKMFVTIVFFRAWQNPKDQRIAVFCVNITQNNFN